MNQLHPTIAQALEPFAPPAESPELQAYRAALRRFDWQFEASEDGSVIRRARADLKVLLEMQRKLDPDASIWRAIAPGGHGEPLPNVKKSVFQIWGDLSPSERAMVSKEITVRIREGGAA